jgi:hypothetical protein
MNTLDLNTVFTPEVVENLKKNKNLITQELLQNLRACGNEGKQLALDILDTEKDDEEYYTDAFGSRISFNGFRMLKKAYTKMHLSDIHVQELKRCINDLDYFMMNYVKIKTNKGVNFPDLRSYQKKFLEALTDDCESIVGLMPRQSGKSITTSIYLAWKFIFSNDMNIGICANKSKLAAEFLNNVKNIYMELPMWMKIGVKSWNAGSISGENGMRIMTDSTNGDSFRGYTVSILVVDECAFIKSTVYDEFENSIFPSQSALSWKKNVIISTANGLNHFYNLVKGARQNKVYTVENSKLPELKDVLSVKDLGNGTSEVTSKLGINGYEMFETSWKDVPRYDTKGNVLSSEQFKENIIEKYGLVYWNSNYENKFIGSSNTFVSSNILEVLNSVEPLEIRDNKLKIYKKPEKGHKYIISVDPAKEGIDAFAIQVLDITSICFEQVASANLQVDYLTMPDYLNEYGQYYNNAFMIIENNEGAGQSIADIMRNDYEYENLFKDTGKKYPGFRTTAKTRSLILNTMRMFIENDKLKIHDRITINEFYSFILINNKYQADDGCHDDAVMSLALAFAPFCNTRNFEDIKDLVAQISAKTEMLDPDNSFTDYMNIGMFDDNGDDEYFSESTDELSTYDSNF